MPVIRGEEKYLRKIQVKKLFLVMHFKREIHTELYIVGIYD